MRCAVLTSAKLLCNTRYLHSLGRYAMPGTDLAYAATGLKKWSGKSRCGAERRTESERGREANIA
eukprot:1910996-Rhodomonas_salina.1